MKFKSNSDGELQERKVDRGVPAPEKKDLGMPVNLPKPPQPKPAPSIAPPEPWPEKKQ